METGIVISKCILVSFQLLTCFLWLNSTQNKPFPPSGSENRLAILMLGTPVSGSTSVTPTMTSGTAAVASVPLSFPRLGTGFSLLAGKGAGTSAPPLSGSRSAAGRWKTIQSSHIKESSIKSNCVTSVSFQIHTHNLCPTFPLGEDNKCLPVFYHTN